jgi:hypothetical protein
MKCVFRVFSEKKVTLDLKSLSFDFANNLGISLFLIVKAKEIFIDFISEKT